MSKTKKIFLSLFLALCAICLAFAMTACKGDDNKNDDPSSVDPGTNTSESIYGLGEEDWYYYEAADTYYIRLLSGTYTLYMESVLNSSGTYTFNDARNQVIFTDSTTGDTFTATYVENFLSLDLGTSGWTFHKYVYFDVTYVGLDGQTVATEKVLNGQPAVRIDAADGRVDKSADGYYFVNWYGDADLGAKYGFDISVTGDTKIYAKYILVDEAATIFEVKYDYTSRAADHAGAAKTGETVNNVVFNLPEADGLLGWWVSETNVSDELSYRYIEGETALYADTTLFAVWEGSLGASVTADGVTWETAIGSDTTVVVTDSTGEMVASGTALSSSGKFTSEAFAALGTGKYTVTVSSGSQTETLVYIVNGLSRVSHFSVEDHVLVYNSVPGATNYYIKIDCGSENHNHTYVNNGTSLVYDFSDCDMPAEGINFVVYAYADGMYASVSETFNYFLGFERVVVSISDDVASWNEILGSDGTKPDYYEVYIGGSLVATTSDLSYSLEYYDANTVLEVQVKAVSKGYYSEISEPTQYGKMRLATPVVTGFDHGSLTWEKVEGAIGYVVYISGNAEPFNITGGDTTTFITGSDNFTREGAYVAGQGSYEIQIMALASDSNANSKKSEILVVMENELEGNSLTYKDGVVSWSYVLDADSYLISVNNETEYEGVYSVTGKNSCEIAFTKEGENIITVYFMSGETKSQTCAILKIDAYALTLDLQGGTTESVDGSTIQTTLYFAEGDTVTLPDVVAQSGYEFAGWYTLPDAVEKTADSPIYYEGDGKLYANGTVFDPTIQILYAFYAPKAYTVTFTVTDGGYLVDMEGNPIFEDDGVTCATSCTMTVYYQRRFNLLYAVEGDATEQFAGWYTQPNKGGTLYEDGDVWAQTENKTLYSGYNIVLSFTLTTYNGNEVYAASKGKEINLATEITVPAQYKGIKVAILQSNAFTNCTTLEVVNLPDTMEYISTANNGYTSGSGSFAGCSALKEVNIVPTEGNHERCYYSDGGVLFHKTGDLEVELIYFPHALTVTEYVVPEIVYNYAERDGIDGGLVYSVTSLSTQVFKNNTYFTKISLPATLVTVNSQVFSGCTNLQTILFNATVVDGVQSTALSIGTEAFKNCSSLTEITLPSYMTSFNYAMFDGCTKLVNTYISGSSGEYSSSQSDPGVILGDNGHTLVYYPVGRDGAFTIYDTAITKIGEYAAYGNRNITSIIIPEWVTTVDEFAFYGCSGVETLTFGGVATSNALTIEGYAFFNCASIAEVELPMNLIALKAYAFGGCRTLSKVVINGADVTNYEADAFANTLGTSYVTTLIIGEYVPEMEIMAVFGYNITTLEIDSGNTNYFTNTDGLVYNASKTNVLYCPADFSGEVTLLDGVVELGGNVFRTRNITGIVIPGSVTKIGDNAFSNCVDLEKVTFVERENEECSLTIGEYAFSGCTGLTSIEIPAYTSVIGDYAFYGCRKLESVKTNSGLEKIGSHAFDSCVKLTNLELTACEGLEIGDHAFSACSALGSVIVPAGTRKIGDYAFYNCYELVTVTLNEGLVTIGDYAFNGCVRLAGISIPASVKEIGPVYGPYYVFNGCAALSSLTISEGNQNFAVDGGTLYGIEQDASSEGGFRKTDLYMALDAYTGEVTVPNTITKIWENAFASSKITKVTFVGKFDDLEIGEGVFSGCTTLTEIVLPAGLTEISANMFSGCSALTTVNIPYTVSRIEKAFTNCSALVAITFDKTPDGVTPVELEVAAGTGTSAAASGAFYGSAITEIEFPERLTSIPTYLFSASSTLTAVTIPSTVESIGYGAFYSCTKLVSVTFAENGNLTTIENAAFHNCTSLTSIAIPEGVTELANGSSSISTFASNTSLKYVSLPTSLTYIGDYVFTNCSVLYSTSETDTVLKIPDAVTTIGIGSFNNCKALVGIGFGDGSTLRTVGTSAFNGCSALKSVEFPATLEVLGADNGDETASASIGSKYSFSQCTALESVTFKTYVDGANAGKCSLRIINGAMFYKCTALTYFEFPETTEVLGAVASGGTSLGDALFDSCTALTKVKISSSVTSVTRVFDSCTSINEIEVASGNVNLTADSTNHIVTDIEGKILYCAYGWSEIYSAVGSYKCDLSNTQITEIAAYAFYKNTTVTEVILPATLEKVGASAFTSCTKITNLVFSNGSAQLVIEDGTASYGTFQGLTGMKTLTLPTNLYYIGDYAFYGCNNASFTELSIPSAAYIGNYAFNSCSKLTSITLPETGLVSLGENVFRSCSALTTITIPEGVTSLPVYAFGSCSALTTVVLPSSLTSFDGDATNGQQFASCTKLTSINLGYVTTLSYQAFNGCSVLDNITLSSELKEIPSTIFQNCKGLKSISIPDGVEKIGSSAFYGCTGLTEITIPYTVTTIDGTRPFYGCTALAAMNFEPVPENADGDYTLTFGDSSSGNEPFANCVFEAIVLPARLAGISQYMFSGCKNLKIVTYEGDEKYNPEEEYAEGYFSVPEGTQISSQAFKGCTALVTIDLTNAAPETSTDEFSGCTALKYVTFNTETTVIADGMFDGCTALTGIELPEKLEYIGNLAFEKCALTTICVPGTVISIGYSAFLGNTSLTDVVFEDADEGEEQDLTFVSMTSGYSSESSHGTFNGCTSLVEFVFPARTVSISANMFYGCTKLEKVTFETGAAVPEIPNYMFYGCTAMAGFDIPEGVERIGSFAFYNCYALKTIEIPYTVLTVDTVAFGNGASGNSSLSSITFEEIPSGASIVDYPLTFLGYTTEANGLFRYSALTDVTLPERCVALGSYMFADCYSLKTVFIPASVGELGMGKSSFETGNDGIFYNCAALETVTFGVGCCVASIPAKAFMNCTSLVNINLQDTQVKEIKYEAFEACTALENIALPSGLETIAYKAFYQSGLTEIIIPASVTTIGVSTSTPFGGCSSLEEITVEANNADYMSVDGALYSVENQLIAFPAGVTGEVTFGDGVTFGQYACHGCLFSHITLPETLTEISSYAFYSCVNLENVIIPDAVTTIGQHAFDGCTSLKEVQIGTGVTSIGSSAFQDASTLEVIRYNAVQCDALASSANAFYNAGKTSDNGLIVIVGSNVRSLPNYAFGGASANYAYITEVTFEEGSVCESIGTYAFNYCKSLKSLMIPISVTSVGNYATNNCSALAKIYYCGTEEEFEGVSVGSNNSPFTSATVYYYSAEAPELDEEQTAYVGNFWHYVDGKAVEWIYVN